MTQERDVELSALLDGALAARDEAALRAEISREPALAARLAELARVDEELRALPARPVPRDLRARLQAKLDAEAEVRPRLSALRGGALGRISRRRAWGAGFAAAAALVVVVGLPRREADRAADPQIAVTATPLPGELPSSDSEAVAAPVAVAELPVRSPAAPSDVRATDATEIAGRALGPPTSLAGSTDTAAVETLIGEQPAPDLAAAGSAFEPSAEREPELTAPIAAAPTSQLAASASTPLLVELSDDEAEALDELEPSDTGVVAVLDLLDELDSLESGAS